MSVKLPSRRSALALLGAGAAGSALAACSHASTPGKSATAAGKSATAAGKKGTVNIYTWPNYFSSKSLKKFTAKTGITPNISTYDSSDTVFTKLNSPAGTGYDIVVPSSGWVQPLADKGLLAEIDHDKVDLSSLDPSLMNREYDPHNKYSIPKDWGMLGVVYDPDAVPHPIRTWQDFLDAGRTKGVSGRVRMSSSAWETIGISLWIDGKNWNTVGAAAIKDAAKRIKDFAPHVKTFEGFDPATLADGSVVLSQCNQAAARTAIAQNPKLRWVIPGPRSELWVDSYALPKKSHDPDAAYQFLEYELTPGVQLHETEFLGYPAALKGLRGKMPASVKNSDLIFGGKHVDFDKLTTFVVNQKTIGVYQQQQTEIQAAAGK